MRQLCHLPIVLCCVLCSPCSADLVVENFSEASIGGYAFRLAFVGPQSNTWAQKFNTGGDDYSLDSIAVRINRDTAIADFTARLWTSSGIFPDTAVANLSLSNTPVAGQFDTYVFTPDNPFLLDGTEDYFFSVENNLGLNSFLQGTLPGNNFTGPGNILSSIPVSNNSGLTWSTTSTSEAVFRVDGTLASVPEPSSLSCIGVLLALACSRRQQRGNRRFRR